MGSRSDTRASKSIALHSRFATSPRRNAVVQPANTAPRQSPSADCTKLADLLRCECLTFATEIIAQGFACRAWIQGNVSESSGGGEWNVEDLFDLKVNRGRRALFLGQFIAKGAHVGRRNCCKRKVCSVAEKLEKVGDHFLISGHCAGRSSSFLPREPLVEPRGCPFWRGSGRPGNRRRASLSNCRGNAR